MDRIGKDVEQELARTGGGAGLALAGITSVWPEAVGDAVARHAWPLRLGRDGTLHVATTSSTWAFELDRLAPEIEDRLRSLAGSSSPAKLRFLVGPVPEPAASDAAETRSNELPPTTPEYDLEAASLASSIDDPELRELVSRAARASLFRARSGRRF